MLRVQGIDHVVLIVREVEPVLAWYRDVLGLEVLREEAWRAGEVPFVSVRVDEATILDLQQGEPTGRNVDHLALHVEADLDELAASGRFDVVSGPASLFGARGQGRGLYVRDPGGFVVELRTYGS